VSAGRKVAVLRSAHRLSAGTLDHTSTLRLIETRFGVTVPNLSAWRRSVTGDFTGALNLTSPPVTTVPALPSTSIGSNVSVVEEAVLNALAGTLDVGLPYPPRRQPPSGPRSRSRRAGATPVTRSYPFGCQRRPSERGLTRVNVSKRV
jgi:phospholipase C